VAEKNKLSITELRIISEYLSATRNEIAHDEYQISESNSPIKGFPKLPRPAKWIGTVGLYPKLLSLFRFFLVPLWYAFGWIYFIKECKKWQREITDANPINGDEKILLAVSERSVGVIYSNFPESKCWKIFIPPWIFSDTKVAADKLVKISDLLYNSDYTQIMRLAVISHGLLNSRSEFEGWGMQSYTAWRWICARIAVERLPGSFVTTEHFDRWAVLVDRAAHSAKRNKRDKCLTLIQHGSVNAKSLSASLNFILPTRLKAVDELWVYSILDENIFRNEILSSRVGKLSVNYFSSKISLTPTTAHSGVSVLIVGHPLCEEFHIMLAAQLSEREAVRIYYKPHPVAQASKKIRRLNCLIFCEKNEYPSVDVVVSYPSSLVEEYAVAGILVVEHNMNAGKQDLVQIESNMWKQLRTK
jgi:hypothetical protein